MERYDELTFVKISRHIEIIGDCAFFECASLYEINIPDSVKRIGEYAIYGCPKLYRIVYKGTKEQWERIDKDELWFDECYDKDAVIRCKDGDIPLNRA